MFHMYYSTNTISFRMTTVIQWRDIQYIARSNTITEYLNHGIEVLGRVSKAVKCFTPQIDIRRQSHYVDIDTELGFWDFVYH